MESWRKNDVPTARMALQVPNRLPFRRMHVLQASCPLQSEIALDGGLPEHLCSWPGQSFDLSGSLAAALFFPQGMTLLIPGTHPFVLQRCFRPVSGVLEPASRRCTRLRVCLISFQAFVKASSADTSSPPLLLQILR